MSPLLLRPDEKQQSKSYDHLLARRSILSLKCEVISKQPNPTSTYTRPSFQMNSVQGRMHNGNMPTDHEERLP
ncbi:hypothetical protein M430DRAFT_32470 [Amorphotheca resinae ATCC 22711]|uniref:Uncharacterized protein n=1 Tax=Amorphotheca resinae ATCC 22711 TaxID=857342 RepID=A0A2T3BET0_AMORE|nr:hypothetical protein M430DRAFT_32470 [Amorphotheca resinae ATCC 22711]PSS27901.1 hypothetical protein M430DRAFT_32470 [Amorphotheca resinae ATCC 22711]